MNLLAAAACEVDVIPGVRADLAALRDGAGENLRVLGGALTEHKEGALGVVAREDVENARRERRMGAVIKSQRHILSGNGHAADAAPREGRHTAHRLRLTGAAARLAAAVRLRAGLLRRRCARPRLIAVRGSRLRLLVSAAAQPDQSGGNDSEEGLVHMRMQKRGHAIGSPPSGHCTLCRALWQTFSALFSFCGGMRCAERSPTGRNSFSIFLKNRLLSPKVQES